MGCHCSAVRDERRRGTGVTGGRGRTAAQVGNVHAGKRRAARCLRELRRRTVRAERDQCAIFFTGKGSPSPLSSFMENFQIVDGPEAYTGMVGARMGTRTGWTYGQVAILVMIP